jgi:trk system potassium uptake protein TrkH
MSANLRVVANILGLLLVFNGLFMLLCLPASLIYNPSDLIPIAFSAAVTIGVGLLAWVLTRAKDRPTVRKREGFLIVTFGWVVMALSGTLPYVMSGSVVNFTDAFFESISGYTTTGATIISDLDLIPRDILLWRSLTQWMGGMGIIVLAVAILPVLGIGGMQLFMAESPGIRYDKVQPRIRETAKRLWFIYFGLTLMAMVLLRVAGMTWFDAVNHALTTVASGGFSTHNDSIAGFSPLIQYIIIVFMFITGVNYTLLYFGLNGKFQRLLHNEELRFYSGIIALVTLGVTAVVWNMEGFGSGKAFRDSLFQAVSFISSTGYVSADYTSWSPFITMLFFVMMFIGGMAGSTAGGVKIVRHVVLVKNSILELKRQLHPSGVIPVRLNKRAIDPAITYSVVAFVMMYLTIFALGCIVMTFIGVDFPTALGSVASAIGNVGPAIGSVGPVHTYAEIPAAGKWFLGALMLIGRLELFTVLVLFTPYFWRRF